MGLLNNIFRWFILERLKQIEGFASRPFEIQHRVLSELIKAGEETEFGKRYSFPSINSAEQFQNAVPIQDYYSLKDLIVKSMSGEENVLWPGRTNWYAKSSGTTDDKSKFIPVTEAALNDCHFRAGKDMYALYYYLYENADLVDGKSLVVGGSHQVSKVNENTYCGDLSAVLMQNLPTWAEVKRVPELSIALMDNWEDKLEKMARSTIRHSVTNLLGVPTWTLLLIRRILEITGKDNLAEIWPSLELYVHGGVNFEPYRKIFQSLIRKENMHYMETYNASEGFFGIQDQKDSADMLLMIDYGIYYEFIAFEDVDKESPLAIPLEGVELNKNYAVVISTNAGLWRYKLGDTIIFTSKQPYRIKITGRTKHFINAFGEELVVENAERAISNAAAKTGALVCDFTAAPIYFSEGESGAHEWYIEFDQPPYSIEEFASIVDVELKVLNSDYEAKRFKDIALRPPLFHPVPRGTFYGWMKKRGKLGGQNKVPRLSNSREIVEDLEKFISEQAS